MEFIEDRNSNDDPSDDLNFDNYFTDLTPDGNPLPSLGLNRLYVLTSNRTASSSELLINGLKPHIRYNTNWNQNSWKKCWINYII